MAPSSVVFPDPLFPTTIVSVMAGWFGWLLGWLVRRRSRSTLLNYYYGAAIGLVNFWAAQWKMRRLTPAIGSEPAEWRVANLSPRPLEK